MHTLIPTQLYLGPEDHARAQIELFLQTTFCTVSSKTTPQAECFCTQCRNVKNRQHANMLWLAPEHDYKIDDLEIIFEKARLSLDANQHFYFVLEKAETLSVACANKLLKIMEEPPAGYHFILMTSNEESLLATIRSRCHITRLKEQVHHTLHPFLNFFCAPILTSDPSEFEQELRSHHFSDTQSTQLAHDLLHNFAQRMIALHVQDDKEKNQAEKKRGEKIIEFIQKMLRYPPQSGSSELFWKNFYLHFPHKQGMDPETNSG